MRSSVHMPRRRLTLLYCLHQASYFMAYSGIGAFSVAYLLEKGFSSAQVGVMLAITNILSCVLQPLIGSGVDRRSQAMLSGIIRCFLLISLIAFLCVEVLSLPLAVLALLFVLGTLALSITLPLGNSLCAYYSQNGYHINYGVGSGAGALSFSLGSLLVGHVISTLGMRAMVFFCLAIILMQALLMLLYPRIDGQTQQTTCRQPAKSLSLTTFCRQYRRFLATLLGVTCLAACHVMAECYLIHIFARLGGDSGHVGNALFLSSISAMPLMLLFEKIQRKADVLILLRLSGLFYVFKAILLIFAPTIGCIYLIQLLHTCTYGFLYPPLYYFVNLRIRNEDTAKGQMIASSLYTLGSALGNSLGGTVIDGLGLNAMLSLAALLAVGGMLLINITIGKADAS